MTSASITNVPVMNPQVQRNASAKNGGEKVGFMDLMNRTIDVAKELNTADRIQNDNLQKDVQGQDAQDVKTNEYKFDRSKENKITLKSEENDPETLKKVKEAVDSFGEDVKKVLKEELGVSDKEIEAKMAELGLSVMDLANPKELTNLVSALTGQEDTVLLLMRSDVSDILSQVGELTKNLVEELNMEPAEINGLMMDIEADGATEAISFRTALENEVHVTSETQEETVVAAPESNAVLAESVETVDTVKDEMPEEEVVSFTVEAAPKKDSETVKDRPAEIIVSEEGKEPESPVTGLTLSAGNKNGAQTGEGQEQGFDPNKNLFNPDNKDAELNVRTDDVAAFTQAVNEKAVSEIYSQDVEAVTPYSNVDVNQVINDIAEAARVTITEEVRTMEMVLNPEHLGKVYMEVSSEQGRVTARLMVENEAVKNALENQLALLKETMTNSGTKIEAVEVTVGTHEFDKQLEEGMMRDEQRREAEEEAERQANKGGRRSLNLNDLDSLQGLMSEEEELMARIMRDEGNTVNYQA